MLGLRLHTGHLLMVNTFIRTQTGPVTPRETTSRKGVCWWWVMTSAHCCVNCKEKTLFVFHAKQQISPWTHCLNGWGQLWMLVACWHGQHERLGKAQFLTFVLEMKLLLTVTNTVVLAKSSLWLSLTQLCKKKATSIQNRSDNERLILMYFLLCECTRVLCCYCVSILAVHIDCV